MADRAEADRLRHLAAADNLNALDFTTRRIAVAWLNDRPIGCAWIATGSFEESELGLVFELQPGDAWLFAAVVEPSSRNKGVYSQLLAFLIEELKRDGIRRILLGVTFGNDASQRAHARQGATKVGEITAARCLGVTICRRIGRVSLMSPRAIALNRFIRLAVDA